MASHASKFLSDRVQADGVDKNVWEWAEKRIKNSLNFQNVNEIKVRKAGFWRYSDYKSDKHDLQFFTIGKRTKSTIRN